MKFFFVMICTNKAIQPYLNDSEFDPDFVRTKSGAAAGLCAWVCSFDTEEELNEFHSG